MLDQEKYKEHKVTIRKDETKHDEMSVYELARWMCLIESVDIISEKCDSLGLPEKNSSWVKPIAIQKYVDERTEGMLFELTNQGKL
tara:strand:- start:388 stop:645 length:258 start_codon:yes stop_codon:yes gene_type:complete